MSCIFCDILSGVRDSHMIYEDASHVAFLDKYPIDVGHSLVVPKNHHERITDMNHESVGNMFSIVPKIANAVLTAIAVCSEVRVEVVSDAHSTHVVFADDVCLVTVF